MAVNRSGWKGENIPHYQCRYRRGIFRDTRDFCDKPQVEMMIIRVRTEHEQRVASGKEEKMPADPDIRWEGILRYEEAMRAWEAGDPLFDRLRRSYGKLPGIIRLLIGIFVWFPLALALVIGFWWLWIPIVAFIFLIPE